MEIETLEILDYVSGIPPFNSLNEALLSKLVGSMEITFIRGSTIIVDPDKDNQYLYLIRTGAVEITDQNGTLLGRPAEGEWFGQRSLLSSLFNTDNQDNTVNSAVDSTVETVTALENCLLYLLPKADFLSLLESSQTVKAYFSTQKPERIRAAIGHLQQAENTTLIASKASDLVHGTPLFIEQTASIAEAAKLMTENTVTAMLINHQGKLSGIVTDRAFCTKVVAGNMDSSLPVSAIMTPAPITITENTQGSTALLLMARHNIRHIPVTRGDEVVGMLTATDIIRKQSSNAIYLINEIHRAKNTEELISLSEQLPETLVSLVESSLTAHDIGQTISSIGQAITHRLIHLAENALGKPPVDYCWICAGSMARGDQTAHSDQDNAMIFANDYDTETHHSYFQQLAKSVSDGLNACGYVYCPGDVMATNPKWSQPVSVWESYFKNWIECPKPKALMHASIFFDLRFIYGEKSLLKNLRKYVLKKAQNNTLFLKLMAENALHYQPPLGFFRNFVLEKGGEHGKALNMKKKGVVPIIDLARVYALNAGVKSINTDTRLRKAQQQGAISHEGMRDLQDAYEFIGSVRLQHQAKQIKQGREPDNFLSLDDISSLERRHLKDAFEVVTTLQKVMNNNFQM